MAKGLLVSYAGYPYALSSLFPDNGLASLAAVLVAAGHECRILDFNGISTAARIVGTTARERLKALLPRLGGEPDGDVVAELEQIDGLMAVRARSLARELGRSLARRCQRDQIDFVGFKLWSGHGFEASVEMAEIIRSECPAVKLFAGGPAVHYSGDVVLAEASVFDAIVDGEGEPAIVALARHAEGARGLAGIPNLLRPGDREGGTVRELADMARLPPPLYTRETYPSLWDGSKIKLICVDESRGCPLRCAFCVNWCIEGDRWRTRNAGGVVSQMKEVRASLGTRAFRMAGTYSHPRLVREVCELIIASALDVEFSLFMNAGGVTPELVALLRQAGCFGLFFGIESGSDEILDSAMNKHISAERMRRALVTARDGGLFTAGSFIYPAPGETPQSEEQTRRFIQELFAGHPNTSVLVTAPGLIPRTTWWQERARFGFELGVSEEVYRKRLLRYQIRHLLPSQYWEPAPYSLDGCGHTALLLRTGAFQRWVEGIGVCSNLPDHDAQIGAVLGQSPVDFKRLIRRLIFTGDAEGLQRLTDEANEGLAA